MHFTQLLALFAATTTAVAALPLQRRDESSAPLGKRFYYTRYVTDDSISSGQEQPPFNYDQYGRNLAKRFYYTHYIDDDAIDSAQGRPPFDYDQYEGRLGKRFYYTDYVLDKSISSTQEPPPFGYDQYGGNLAKRFYYTRYVDGEDINSADEENYGPGLKKRSYYPSYTDDDAMEIASQEPPPFGYDQYHAPPPAKEANIISHQGKPAHRHAAPKYHEFKPHMGKTNGAAPHHSNGHHGQSKSAWASVKDLLHLD